MTSDSTSTPRPTSPYHPYASRYEVHPTMPEHGVDRSLILAELAEMAHNEDSRADAGRVSGSIYSGDHEHYAFLTKAFEHFAHSNVMQRDMYPSATKMEAEIISMTTEMLHGSTSGTGGDGSGSDDDGVGGLLTSGGTESLVTAMHTYREWGRNVKGIEAPQVIMPVTGHPAMDKAFHYFGIDVVRAPVTDQFVVDVDFVRDHIGPRTVALIGTAGTYPHGLIDPITELGQLAIEHDIGLHVDGCLGGFILPWATELGYDLTPFDFSVPGVTSISADTHKYGYALKGSSVLLFRPKTLRRHQYFVQQGWPGGMYASPSMGGSRSGGLIAATWASMLSLGKSGYRSIAADIFATAEAVKSAVRSHPELQLIGDPRFNVAFRSADAGDATIDIFHVNDELTNRGWRMNGLQLPPALHFCITRPNTQAGVADAFTADLAEAVAYARRQSATTMPKSGAMYGAGGRVADPDRVVSGMLAFFDAVHEVGPLR